MGFRVSEAAQGQGSSDLGARVYGTCLGLAELSAEWEPQSVIRVFPASTPAAHSSSIATPEGFLPVMSLVQGNSSRNLLPKAQTTEETPCSWWDGGSCDLCRAFRVEARGCSPGRLLPEELARGQPSQQQRGAAAFLLLQQASRVREEHPRHGDES